MKIEKEDIFKVISAITTIFVLMGIMNAFFYYYIFGIDILEYAAWNEYVFFFLKNLFQILLFLLIFLVAREFVNESNFYKRNIFIIMAVSGIGSLLFFSLYFDQTRRFLFTSSVFIYIIYALAFCLDVGWLYAVKLSDQFSKQSGWPAFGKNYFLIIKYTVPVLIITVMVVVPAYIKAYKIIKKPSERDQVVLYLKDKIKATTDSLVYAGKTEKFYFFYNLSSKQAEVITASSVDSCKISRQRIVFSFLDPLQ